MNSLWKIGLLALLAFFAQTLLSTPLDLMFLVTVLAVKRWGVRGGVIAGGFSGLLLSVVSSASPLRVIFFYAVMGYLVALILDTWGASNLPRDLAHSAAITGLYVLAENSLFINQGLTRLDLWSWGSAPFHFVAVALILQLSRYWSVDGGSRSRSSRFQLIESIVR